jgi:hypothetical protein
MDSLHEGGDVKIHNVGSEKHHKVTRTYFTLQTTRTGLRLSFSIPSHPSLPPSLIGRLISKLSLSS